MAYVTKPALIPVDFGFRDFTKTTDTEKKKQERRAEPVGNRGQKTANQK